MYQDPNRIRRRYAALNLDSYEASLIDALVNYTGVEKATLIRQLVLKEATETLGVAELGSSMRQGHDQAKA